MDSSDIQNTEFRMKETPDSEAERDFEGFESDESALIDDVVPM